MGSTRKLEISLFSTAVIFIVHVYYFYCLPCDYMKRDIMMLCITFPFTSSCLSLTALGCKLLSDFLVLLRFCDSAVTGDTKFHEILVVSLEGCLFVAVVRPAHLVTSVKGSLVPTCLSPLCVVARTLIPCILMCV